MSDPRAQPHQPAYVDPVTGAPVYVDPATGQYVYATPPVGGYPQHAGGQYYPINYGYGDTPETNGLAIASLVVAIGGTIACGFVGSIVGAILGHVARRQIAHSGENGAGLALAGIIVGWSITALYVIVIVLYVLAFTTSN